MSSDEQHESVMFPYQVRWLADRHPVLVAEKSRQIGFTFSTAAKCVLNAAIKGGRNTWYVGYNHAMSSEFIADAAYWADLFEAGMRDIGYGTDFYIDGNRRKSVLTYGIKFASGNGIYAVSSHPENLRGKRGNLIIDEAAFHPDLPGLIKAGIALTIGGGQMMIISTHNGDTNPFNQYIEEVKAGKYDTRIHHATFREAVAQGLYKRLCTNNGIHYDPQAEPAWIDSIYRRYGDDADEELDVIPSRGRAGYISVQAIDRSLVAGRPVLRLALDNDFVLKNEHDRQLEVNVWFEKEVRPYVSTLPQTARHFLGGDFGRSVDKTSFAPLSEGEGLGYACPFIIELHNVPHEEQWTIFSLLVDSLPNFAACKLDRRGNGEWLAEKAVSRYSGRVEGLSASDAFYRLHMPKFKAAFDDARLTVPMHTDVLQDLRSIDVVNGVPKIPSDKRRRGTDGMSRHGDSAMSLFYAWIATETSGPEPASVSVSAPAGHYIRRRQNRLF